MARGRSFPRRTRGSRSELTWFAGGLSAAAVLGDVKTQLSTLNAAGLALRPFTIMRTRLTVLFESDQAIASERPQGAFGIVIVNDVASALGITGVPGPVTDPNSPWLVYQGLVSSFLLGDATGFINDGSLYEIDSKAMRKVGENENINFMVEMRTAPGAIITIEGRMLVKLH